MLIIYEVLFEESPVISVVSSPDSKISFVLFDDRKSSPTKGEVQEIILSEKNYQLVTVPPMIWNGFSCLGEEPSIIANFTDVNKKPFVRKVAQFFEFKSRRLMGFFEMLLNTK